MKKITLFIFLVLAYNIFSADITVLISPEKTIFYRGEEIKLYFKVINTSDKIIQLNIADYKPFNYYIKVYTPENTPVKEKDDFFSEYLDRYNGHKKNIIKTEFSTTKLEPNGIIGITIDINKIYDLQPGIYLVVAEFYPLSILNNSVYLYKSPTIKIIVKEDIKLGKKEEKYKELPKTTTPEQSIRYFFDGKLERNWEKFFSVLHLRELIKYFPTFKEAYENSTDDEKNKILNDFKTFLKDLNSDEKFINYTIEEIVIRKDKAIAKVITTSRFQEIIIKREYKIGLMLHDQWYIYGYSVLQKR
ncbi:MAG TPA: hypothetical protein PKW55_02620 [Spirochaetota bacterium]|nr:hypothetical protein [Spirochaetota bacterium]HOM38257.1 hypothetical protein [Spirochaetota bacterium]HPQ48525.1 hypothetical protein [Spirochaetota bacterium]